MCVIDSEMDSLILESCREFGPSLNTYSRVAQTLKSRSPDEVHLLFHVSLLSLYSIMKMLRDVFSIHEL